MFTPNLDKLADTGALFSNFYTVTPLCTPARASFFSGLYPAFTGESDMNHGRMGDDVTTFAEVLRDQGDYSTSFIGKWHLNGEGKMLHIIEETHFCNFHESHTSNLIVLESQTWLESLKRIWVHEQTLSIQSWTLQILCRSGWSNSRVYLRRSKHKIC